MPGGEPGLQADRSIAAPYTSPLLLAFPPNFARCHTAAALERALDSERACSQADAA